MLICSSGLVPRQHPQTYFICCCICLILGQLFTVLYVQMSILLTGTDKSGFSTISHRVYAFFGLTTNLMIEFLCLSYMMFPLARVSNCTNMVIVQLQ